MNESKKAQERMGQQAYRKAYLRGWRHSQTANASLDNQPGGQDEGWAWEDGYMDYAGGREKWHRRDCELADHNDCPTQ
jgi:hypothetical protein